MDEGLTKQKGGKKMKVTANSTFHGNYSVSFRLKEGWNIRRIKKRATYCLDYSHNNSHVCGCGFPTAYTKWECPDGYHVEEVFEGGRDDMQWGKGYLYIYMAPDEIDIPEEVRDQIDKKMAEYYERKFGVVIP